MQTRNALTHAVSTLSKSTAVSLKGSYLKTPRTAKTSTKSSNTRVLSRTTSVPFYVSTLIVRDCHAKSHPRNKSEGDLTLLTQIPSTRGCSLSPTPVPRRSKRQILERPALPRFLIFFLKGDPYACVTADAALVPQFQASLFGTPVPTVTRTANSFRTLTPGP